MYSRKRFTLCIILLAFSLTSSTSRVNAFSISTHRKITFDALVRSNLEYNGVTMSFDQEGAREIERFAAYFDRDAALGLNHTEDYRHFDDESFAKGSEYVIEMKNKTIAELSRDDMDDFALRRAIEYFAYGMHAVQDFYAHSNWVELGHHDICPTLGIGPFQVPIASELEKTCTDNYKLVEAGLTKLTSGYWPGWKIKEVLPGTTKLCRIPENKCHHGKNGCYDGKGIAKDPEGEPDSKPGDPLARKNCGINDPNCKYRDEAVWLATKATITYAQLILKDEGVKRHCKNVARFMKGPR